MDEQERLERRAHIRLIITEVLMVFAVVFLVGFLTLVVMGYSFNLYEIGGEGEVVERAGLAQMSSVPAGATIEIDGGVPLLLRTNASRTLSSGEHKIKFMRDGFFSWEKTINIVEGMVYRVNYPRLILKEREAEEFALFSEEEEPEFLTVSPNKERMIVLVEKKLYLVELNSNKPELKELGLVRADKDGTKTALNVETAENAKWSGNSERVLLRLNGEYVVVNVRNPEETVYFSELRAVEGAGEASETKSTWAEKKTVEFLKLEFESEAGERLIGLTGERELAEISLREKTISEPLAENIIKFDNDGERVVFLTRAEEDVEEEVEVSGDEAEGAGETSEAEEAEEKLPFEVRAYRVGEEESHLVVGVKTEETRVSTMRYFQDSYILVAEGEEIKVFAGSWPVKDGAMKEIFSEEVGFETKKIEKRGKGMVFQIKGEDDEAVFDIEAEKIVREKTEEEANEEETEKVIERGWVDEFLRYEILEGGRLKILDYDWINEIEIRESGVETGKIVTVSGNNRFIYYFSDGKLGREKIL